MKRRGRDLGAFLGTQREAAREKRQGDPVFSEEAEESEIIVRNTESPTDHPSPVPGHLRAPRVDRQTSNMRMCWTWSRGCVKNWA